ncbi:MAG: hypothetical protein JSU73_07225 [candidate division WOR-3 bacterium]|nr:MAG: hypothetical protein JSU73_07225 [candidate division WOR-3 bacterium]
MKARIRGLLSEVGFSGLEADVYVALLQEPGVTGYRVSRLIGKPAPNTYKALDSLRVKGAAVLDESSGSRTYSALPIGDYLNGLKRSLESRHEAIEKELQGTAVSLVEGGIYKLTTVDQVYARARAMIESARSVILLDVFPPPLAELEPDIRRAARRGVSVFIKAYAAVECRGCDVIAPEAGETADLRYWNGDWLNIVIDCREYLLSFLKPGGAGVHEAVWSRNAYMAVLTYNGILHELLLTRVGHMMRADRTRDEIRRHVRELGRKYFGDSPWREVLPESWTRQWKEHRRRPAPSGKARSAGPRRGRKRRKRLVKEE